MWLAISRFLAWMVALTLIGLGLACFKPQLGRQAKLDAELSLLRSERNAWLERNRLLNTNAQWIKHDRDYLEVQARDRLDLARRGETVVRFGEPK